MPFGIKPVSGIFQCQIEKVLSQAEGVATFIDDVVGEGPTKEIMTKRMEGVFDLLEKSELTIRRDKCEMFLTEILAYWVTG